MLVVVPLNGAVRRFIHDPSVRGDQHGCHHRQRTEGRGHHVGHHVSVVVLAGPEHAAFGLHDAGHGVVDEGEAELDAGLRKPVPVRPLERLREDVPECSIVGLRDGVLRTEPEIHLLVQRVGHAGFREAADGRVGVVNGLDDAAFTPELLDGAAKDLPPPVVGANQFRAAVAGHPELGVLVHISVGVPPHDDGLAPGADGGLDVVHQDRFAEHRAVQLIPDRAVRGLPLLLEIVLPDPVLVRGDRRALDAHTMPLDG